MLGHFSATNKTQVHIPPLVSRTGNMGISKRAHASGAITAAAAHPVPRTSNRTHTAAIMAGLDHADATKPDIGLTSSLPGNTSITSARSSARK